MPVRGGGQKGEELPGEESLQKIILFKKSICESRRLCIKNINFSLKMYVCLKQCLQKLHFLHAKTL